LQGTPAPRMPPRKGKGRVIDSSSSDNNDDDASCDDEDTARLRRLVPGNSPRRRGAAAPLRGKARVRDTQEQHSDEDVPHANQDDATGAVPPSEGASAAAAAAAAGGRRPSAAAAASSSAGGGGGSSAAAAAPRRNKRSQLAFSSDDDEDDNDGEGHRAGRAAADAVPTRRHRSPSPRQSKRQRNVRKNKVRESSCAASCNVARCGIASCRACRSVLHAFLKRGPFERRFSALLIARRDLQRFTCRPPHPSLIPRLLSAYCGRSNIVRNPITHNRCPDFLLVHPYARYRPHCSG
jgi:hypothetical protein